MTAFSEEQTVVFVHGLWTNGLEMALLRRRLERCGFRTVRFPYSTRRSRAAESTGGLNRLVARLEGDVVHLVGHSLGGLVILHLLARYPVVRRGRVCLLGVPLAGSHAARRLAGIRIGRWLLGRGLEFGLLGGVPAWAGGREVGAIAGTLAFGMGRPLGGLPMPNDGTVALSETRLPGLADHLALPVTHTGLLFSAQVAEQVCAFLKRGRFERRMRGVQDPR